MYLKDRSNKNGECWPAIGTIARELHLSRRTVERAIADLEKAGRLIKEQRWRENGGKKQLTLHPEIKTPHAAKGKLCPLGGVWDTS